MADILKKQIADGINNLYNQHLDENEIKLEITNKDHKGDLTFVTFPYLKFSKQKPAETANAIGNYVIANCSSVSHFNVVNGFLNFEISDSFCLNFLKLNFKNTDFGSINQGNGKCVMVEFASPNTNKPLHLGHLRNILLGYSVSEILKFAGYNVISANLINDRGIHICKSMLAWSKGNGETPQSSNTKGDHLVGKYYVEFDKIYRKEIEELKQQGIPDDEAKKTAPSIVEAQNMLVKWEQHDPHIIALWKKMNNWVYDGFEQTYKRLGVTFDKYYYESNTYLLGKDLINEGLQKKVFVKDPDGSVWIDLTQDGLDRKIVLRADGTSVYITQDLGTAQLKYDEYKMDNSIYVVGNEQDYHFKVLKIILQKLGKQYANGIFHLSYGMVDLPHGKMKSREGTVVEADELMDEMYSTANKLTMELGKTEGFTENELKSLNETIAMGALKYYLLKVEHVKRMLFNPEESIDFHGNTGPFIQYTFARISSVLRNTANNENIDVSCSLHISEKELIITLLLFPQKVMLASQTYNPSVIANYIYEISKLFNRLYHELSILGEPDSIKKSNRVAICRLTAIVIKNGMKLLGIAVPERM
ncbi:MAG: arginine--tRNA ligase [Bacteroidetes bacterium]|nr:arginine--tRNA ligase [Bacteroidota bacterium]